MIKSDLWRPLQQINRKITYPRVKDARWLAIAQNMGLGDVVACLPMAGILKAAWPHLKICFIGNSYVRPLIDCCEHIDQLLDTDSVLADPGQLKALGVDIFINPFPNRELAITAYQAGVPIRVGNLRRPKIIRYCNRFVMYSRNSDGRHEIELNLENLAGLGMATRYPRADIPNYFGLTRIPELDNELQLLLDPQRLNIIIHPKSCKNGREWPAAHYLKLVRSLPRDRFQLLATGSAQEYATLQQEIPELFAEQNLINLCDKLSIKQFLALISRVDGLVASGTGPLHVAAAMGKHALGIFPPRRRIGPSHWSPIGIKGEFLCLDKPCSPGGERCPDKFNGGSCLCTAAITPEQVMLRVMSWGGYS
jgi:heptosyltransferase III